jgi:hypothetical protein
VIVNSRRSRIRLTGQLVRPTLCRQRQRSDVAGLTRRDVRAASQVFSTRKGNHTGDVVGVILVGALHNPRDEGGSWTQALAQAQEPGITSAYLAPSSFPQTTCRSRLRPRLKSFSGRRGSLLRICLLYRESDGVRQRNGGIPLSPIPCGCRWASGALRLASCQPSGDPAWILRHPVPPYDLIVWRVLA